MFTKGGYALMRGGGTVMVRSDEEFLGAGEVIDEPHRALLSDGAKTWRDEKGRIFREGDRATVVRSDGAMEWWYPQGDLLRYDERLPWRIRNDATVDPPIRIAAHYPPSEVREVRYAGVSYSVPYWLLEAYLCSTTE